MAMHWYVLHVYSGFEKKVADSIQEQARQKHMEEAFEEILVPTEEVVEMRRGQRVNAERKFFPGYVLIKMDMSDESWHLVKDTPKVTGFLGSKGRPSPITEGEATRILRGRPSFNNAPFPMAYHSTGMPKTQSCMAIEFRRCWSRRRAAFLHSAKGGWACTIMLRTTLCSSEAPTTARRGVTRSSPMKMA